MAPRLLENILKAASAYGSGSKSVAPTATAGKGGATAFGGYLVDREKTPALSGKQRFITYSDLLANTSLVAAGTRYFLNILSKQAWSVEPAMDGDGQPLPGAQEAADLVESVMDDMTTSWSKVIRRAAMYRFYGFGIQEWTAKRRDDGQLGMLDVEARPQSTIERWDLDDNGTVLGAWQRPEMLGGELYLPRKKIIHLVDDALNDSPEGLGIFRHLVRAAKRLEVYERLEQVAFETDLRGIPIARAPLAALRAAEEKGKMTSAQVNKLLAPLNAFIGNHIKSLKSGMVLDSETFSTDDEKNAPSGVNMWDLQLLQGSSTSQEAVANAINRINREMALVIGVEHLLLGSDGSGSLALSQSKTTDFYMTVAGALGDVKDGYNRDYVGPVCDLNGIKPELRPKLKTEDVQFKDAEKMADTLLKMAQAGATLPPDDPAINEMRELLGLTRVPQDIIDRTMADATMKHGAELDALNAKATALMGGGKPATDTKTGKPGDKGKATGDKQVQSGEAGGKTTGTK